MSAYTEYIGNRIRIFRKSRGWSMEKLGEKICKSTGAIAKYETGRISVDIETLHDIAGALGVDLEQLILYTEKVKSEEAEDLVPAFFAGISRLYMYIFDGRNQTLSRSVIEIGSKEKARTYRANLYMGFRDYDRYQICENTYTGFIYHFDSLSRMIFQNRDTPMEQYTVNILSSFLNGPYKWALNYGLSFRPFMPIAIKALITKEPAQETKDFIESLHVSKEDIRLFKQYNMMTVTG